MIDYCLIDADVTLRVTSARLWILEWASLSGPGTFVIPHVTHGESVY